MAECLVLTAVMVLCWKMREYRLEPWLRKTLNISICGREMSIL